MKKLIPFILIAAQTSNMAQIEAMALFRRDGQDKRAFEKILIAPDAGPLKFLAATMLKELVDRMNQIGLDKKLSMWLNRQLILTKEGEKGLLYPFLLGVTADAINAKRFILKDYEKLAARNDKEVKKITKDRYDKIYGRALDFLVKKEGLRREQVIAGLKTPGSRINRQMGTIMWDYVPAEKKKSLLEKELAKLNIHYKKVIDALRKLGEIQVLIDLPRSLDLTELKRYQRMMIRAGRSI